MTICTLITRITGSRAELSPLRDVLLDAQLWTRASSLSSRVVAVTTAKRVQKRIAYWDKQNNDVPAPNCVLKIQEEIIKVEGL